jgi:hypothetical protein
MAVATATGRLGSAIGVCPSSICRCAPISRWWISNWAGAGLQRHIYNFPELRRELQALGYHFFSDGDTEVILKAWHAWGEDCVARLHGMFAFAIWDANKQLLFLARDRFGIKPLYWTDDGARLRFASNTQALLAAGGVDTASTPLRCTTCLRCTPWCRPRAPC